MKHPFCCRLFRLPAARAVALSSLLLAAGAARATTYTWTGSGGDNNWTTPGDWQGNVAPPSDLLNTDLIFGNTGAVYPSINTPYSIHSLTFTGNASGYSFDTGPLTLGTGGINQNAANAETFTTAQVILGAAQTWTLASGSGALAFNSGMNTNGYALTVNAATTAGSGNTIGGNLTGSGSLTKTGAGTLTLTGMSTYTGTTTVSAGTLAFNGGGGLNPSSVAALTVDGGTLTLDGGGSVRFTSARIGDAGNGSATQRSGAFATTNALNIGFGTGSTGTYTMTGGSLTASMIFVGRSGSGNFVQSGGSVTTNTSFGLNLGSNGLSSGNYTLGGAGTISTAATTINAIGGDSSFVESGGMLTTGSLTLVANNSDVVRTASYSLNGGTLQTGSIGIGSGGGNTIVNFNGGTLQAGASSTSFFSGLTAANVRNGGAILDTNGYNVTVSQALVHSTMSGDNATDGGLTKNGTGTLTLAAANTYTGATTVNAGTLQLGNVNALQASTLIMTANGALAFSAGLGDSGSINAGALSGSGGIVLRDTANNPVVLSVGGNNASTTYSGSLSGFELDKVGTGTLTLTGAASSLTSLRAYGGTLTLGSGSSITASTLYSGGSSGSGGNVVQNGGSTTLVRLIVGAVGYSTYTMNGGSLTVTSGAILGDGYEGDFTQTGGTVTVAQLYLTGDSTASYGSYSLRGGTLAANGIQSGFNGVAGTSVFTFDGGTLRANTDNTAFMAGLTQAGITANGAFIDTNGHKITVAQTLLSGVPNAATDGGLTKNGPGTLTLTGANTYNGGTSINAGTLLVNNTSGSGTGGGAVTVNGGGTLGGAGRVMAAVTMASNGTINPGSNAGADGSAANVGTLSVGALTLSSTGTAVFDISSGTTYDRLVANGNIALGGATLTLNVPTSNQTFTAGQVLNLFHSTGTLSGTFNNFANDGAYTYGGETFRANYTGTDFTLTALTSVPEPATWAGGALLLGAAGMTLRRRLRAA